MTAFAICIDNQLLTKRIESVARFPVDPAVPCLKRGGIFKFEVGARCYDADVAHATSRPDREEMKRAHEVASHDAWFR